MNDRNIVQLMPTVQEMVCNGYTVRHWLQFYKNVWTRQCTAGAIDIQNDRLQKAIDPEEMVMDGEQVVPVKVRLENRKIALQDGLKVLKAIDALMVLKDDELEAQLFGEDNLKVDEDMLPKPEAEQKEEAPADEKGEEKVEETPAEKTEEAPSAEAAV